MAPENPKKRLADLRFALVGAGRVGGSLAFWLAASGAELDTVAGRNSESAIELCRRLGGRPVALAELRSASLDLLVLAVPDHQLEPVVQSLSKHPQAKVVFHTAGALSAAVLAPLAASGSSVATFHPLKAFPRTLSNPSDAQGVVFSLDGDARALELAARLLRAWDAVGVAVPPEKRRLYHFAASVAAGGVVTLVALAAEISRRLDLPPAVAAGYLALAQGALREVDPNQPSGAITGPAARGDVGAVSAALTELNVQAPDLVPFAVSLLLQTLRQLENEGDSPARARLAEALPRIVGDLTRHDSSLSRTSEDESPERTEARRELSP